MKILQLEELRDRLRSGESVDQWQHGTRTLRLQVIERLALIPAVQKWDAETFQHSGVSAKIAHLVKEVNELAEAADMVATEAKELGAAFPSSIDALKGELADVLILAYGIAARAELDVDEIVREKLEVNKARTWGEPDEQGVIEHVRESIQGWDDSDSLALDRIPVGSLVRVQLKSGGRVEGLKLCVEDHPGDDRYLTIRETSSGGLVKAGFRDVESVETEMISPPNPYPLPKVSLGPVWPSSNPMETLAPDFAEADQKIRGFLFEAIERSIRDPEYRDRVKAFISNGAEIEKIRALNPCPERIGFRAFSANHVRFNTPNGSEFDYWPSTNRWRRLGDEGENATRTGSATLIEAMKAEIEAGS